MEQVVKEQWLLDLRDGTRTQGHGYLRSKDGSQCCLDVLCEQAVRAGVIDPPVLKRPGSDENPNAPEIYCYVSPDGTEDFHYIPRAVQVWAGLTVDNTSMNPSNPFVEYTPEDEDGNTKHFGKVALASLNDEHFLNFEQIADLIENSL